MSIFTVEIMVPANHIPEDLVVDLAGHKLGDTIRWSDIKLPSDVTATIKDRDFVIAAIKVSSAAISADQGEEAIAEENAEGEVPATEQDGDEAAEDGKTSEG
jgi:large subunit ribosomal protein L25